MAQDNNVFIDLETLGLRQDGAIISIGAVKFNIDKSKITDTFHRNFIWATSLKYGSSEPGTLAWWGNQSAEAKAALESPAQVDIDEGMEEFREWLGVAPIVWGNGALFDIGKLEYYFESKEERHPWDFRSTRDNRTVAAIGNRYFADPYNTTDFKGTAHNPVDDARHTALYVCRILNKIRMVSL